MTTETREALSKLLNSEDATTRYEAVELIVDLYDEQFDKELSEAITKETVPMMKNMINAILGHRMEKVED
jgi:hypothetical protein